MKKTTTWIGIVLSFMFFFCTFCSCHRDAPDLSRLQEGNYYVAQDGDHDVVLLVEEVTKQSLKGRWYVENGSVAKSHPFIAEAGRGHRTEMWSDSLVVKADAMHGDTLVLDLMMDGDWRTLSFVPWQQPPVMDLDADYLYHDNLFPVAIDTNVVYARAKGYWTSYPEPDDHNDYLSIVLEKMNAYDLTQKYWDLDMDVYYPITSDNAQRPLLMLIHGGAFFNGDKQTKAFVEWGKHFASMGYVVASINYRIGFVPLGPDHIDRAGYRAVQDAYAAVCYLLRHPERYPIDPNHLFVGGSSAGGITALNLAFMRDQDRPECTKEGMLHKVSHDVNEMVDLLPILDRRERKDIGREDLGDINTLVADSAAVAFNIDAVVNMWGAVHDVGMLENATSTAILSFHGDADSVVAYGFDYPFTKVKRPAVEFLATVRDALDRSGSSFYDLARKAHRLVEKTTKPINQFLCNKMYGSSCIHEKAGALNMKSELHTKAGGRHSLHVNDDGSLSDYFAVITDTTTRFLYFRMFPRPDLNASYTGRQQWFELDNAGEWQTCRWEAIGGLVLEAEPERARVIFFDDADEHQLRLIGQEKNGQGYDETYGI